MKIFRLSKQKYSDDLSGIGAELTGGRWNNKGTRMLYTSDSRALCTAEIAVHVPMGLIPKDYYLITIEVPDTISLKKIDSKSLPKNWINFPYSSTTQNIGEDFIANGKYLILKVPSAVVQGDFNFLINPSHKEFEKVKVICKEKFNFDERLFVLNLNGFTK